MTRPSVKGVTAVIWHGNQQDALDLVNALARNCCCEFDGGQERISTCAAHQMMDDQRLLDRLLFARFIGRQLLAQEWSADDPDQA